MKKKKLLLILVLLTAFIAVFYACSDDEPDEQDNNAEIENGGDEKDGNPEDSENAAPVVYIETKPDEHINLAIDKSRTYQTIEGFGFAHGLNGNKAWYEKIINEMGLTMWRTDISPAIPVDAGWSAKRDEILSLKETADAAGSEFRVILTVWSPPGDFKVKLPEDYMGLSKASLEEERDKRIPQVTAVKGGTLNPDCYEDYAEWLIAALDMYKAIGIDVYALSLQNEPGFEEPYDSGVYTDDWYIELHKAVVPIVKKAYPDVLIFGSECMLDRQATDISWWDKFSYNRALAKDPEALALVDRIATHGYTDGVLALAPARHRNIWEQERDKYGTGIGKINWMTETSGYSNEWDPEIEMPGALGLGIAIQAGLMYGDMAAWVWWSGLDPDDNEFCLAWGNGSTGKKYEVSKHFYRFIRPGSARINVDLPDNIDSDKLMVSAFKNDALDNTVLVFVNTDDKNYGVNIDGDFECYLTTGDKDINCVRFANKDESGEIIIPAKSIVTIINGEYKEKSIEPLSKDEKDKKDVLLSKNALENGNFSVSAVYAGDIKLAKDEAVKLAEPKVLRNVALKINDVAFTPADSVNNQDGVYEFNVTLKKGDAEETTENIFMILRHVSLSDAKLDIDFTKVRQVIDGFGVTGVSNDGSWAETVTGDLEISLWHILINPDNPAGDSAAVKKLAEESLAKTGQKLKSAITVMSPPAEMKDNNSSSGGSLLEANYADFAEWVVGVIKQYKDLGVDLCAVSLQYEPSWPHEFQASCAYTEKSYVEMLNIAAPIIKAAYPDINIMANSMPMMFILTPEWASGGSIAAIMKNNEARENFNIFAINSGGSDEEWRRFRSEYADKANAGDKSAWLVREQGYDDNFGDSAIWLARNMQNAVIFGKISGWLYSDNYMDNPNIYSIIRHFTKFIKPGAECVETTVNQETEDLLISAFKNPDGSAAVQIVNTGDSSYSLDITGLTGESDYYITSVSDADNCRNDGKINTGEKIMIPAKSVVTLVQE